jgi:DnaJ-class molecular chaperone
MPTPESPFPTSEAAMPVYIEPVTLSRARRKVVTHICPDCASFGVRPLPDGGFEVCARCHGTGEVECDGTDDSSSDAAMLTVVIGAARQQFVKCPTCRGKGYVKARPPVLVPCKTCSGSGRVRREESL